MAVNFEIPTEKVTVGKDGGYFTLRGLNSEDLTFLTVNYLDEIKLVVAKQGTKFGAAIGYDRVAEIVRDLSKDVPNLCVEIISRAAEAETPEEVIKVQRLPFVKQLEALQKVWLLTNADGAIDLKNLTRLAASLLEANGLPVEPMKIKLQTIIAGFANPSPS